MNSKKEPLFSLIQSLTMSEKRFFKIFSQRHIIGEINQYLLLFNYIDQNPNCTSEEVAKKSFVKNLSAEKNYLYRLILKALNSYYYEFSHKMKVQNAITNAEILAFKGLEDQALKLLIKGEKLAESAELFSQLLTIKQTQFEILSKKARYTLAYDKIDEIKSISIQNREFTETELKATKLYELRQKTGGLRSKDDLAEYEEFFNKKPKDSLLSKKALLFNISLSITYAHAIKDFEQETESLLQIIALYEENEFLIEYSTKGYISSLYNLANTYRNLGEFDEALKTLDKINVLANHKLITASKFLSAYIFYLSYNLRLYIHIILNDYDKALTIYGAIKKNYPELQLNINKAIVYEHLMLVIRIHVEFKNFKKALRYSNIIINDTDFKHREDIHSYIRLLNLVIHFELKNDFTLDYLSSSTFNYLKRKQRLYKTEKEVIKFITKFHNGKISSLAKANDNLKLLKEDPYEKVMFNLFDFQEWCDTKLQKLQ